MAWLISPSSVPSLRLLSVSANAGFLPPAAARCFSFSVLLCALDLSSSRDISVPLASRSPCSRARPLARRICERFFVFALPHSIFFSLSLSLKGRKYVCTEVVATSSLLLAATAGVVCIANAAVSRGGGLAQAARASLPTTGSLRSREPRPVVHRGFLHSVNRGRFERPLVYANVAERSICFFLVCRVGVTNVLRFFLETPVSCRRSDCVDPGRRRRGMVRELRAGDA